MTETPDSPFTPAPIRMDPEVARRELFLTYHDYVCENGPTCPDRLEAPDAYDEIAPALIAVANVAQQMAMLNFTARFDLTPEQAVAYGVYPVDWATLQTMSFGCVAKYELDNGEEIECTEKGQHPRHKASYMGAPIVWEEPEDTTGQPDTPEQAAEKIIVEAAHEEAIRENAQRWNPDTETWDNLPPPEEGT